MDEEERQFESCKGWKAAAEFVSGDGQPGGFENPKQMGLCEAGTEEGLVMGGKDDVISNYINKSKGRRDSGSDGERVPDLNLVEPLDQPLTRVVGDTSTGAKVDMSTLVTGSGIGHDGGLVATVNREAARCLSTVAIDGMAMTDGNTGCSGFAEDQVIGPCGQDDECCISSGIFDNDRKQVNGIQNVDSCSAPGFKGSHELQNLRDKVEQHSDSITNASAHDSIELPNINFPSRCVADDYKSAEEEFNNGTNLAAVGCSTADHINFLVKKEGDVPFKGDNLSISCKRSVETVSDESENRSQLSAPEENRSQLYSEIHTEKQISSAALQEKENAMVLDKQPLARSDDLSSGPSEAEQYESNDLVLFNKKCILKTNVSTLSSDEMDGSRSNKKSTSQRTPRKTKKRRHEDMAYEGDAEWDNIINKRKRDRLMSSPTIVTDVDSDGTIAVSAGLKAHSVGPAEKLKFKEVLKQKAGLQQYLKCRNLILHLWNKDVSRTLDLLDCGVAATPTKDESPCAPLIRDIYLFLDSHGYINFGVASRKEKTEPVTKHNYKLISKKPIDADSGSFGSISEDGVSFIIGQVKKSESLVEVKNDAEAEDEIQAFVHAAASQSLNSNEQEEITSNQNVGMDCFNLPKQFVSSTTPNAYPSYESGDNRKSPVIAGEEMDVPYNALSATEGQKNNSYQEKCDKKLRKNIIVVGAGAAGLTAARHLQRQGFSVTVLESRDRIGGRVYTDRSSLSVPVDLGASIITGVEADLATERRPDPSSLICAQLGLELTVLNSDCPLYDIVSGNKVPADLDEDLEAEYNSLLDDMVLLVAHQGKKAMNMSLEDGLEYALRKRRMSKSHSNIEEPRWKRSADALCHSVKRSADGIDTEKICSEEDILSPLERRVMNWHFAHLEYGCAALLKEVSLPHWNQDDAYGGFGGAHCMIKGGYSAIVESLGTGISIHFNHIVTDVTYSTNDSQDNGVNHNIVKVSTSNGREFVGDAVLITVPLGCLKAGAIKFSPPLPQWKQNSIKRLGFGTLNKVVLEFPEVFWDDSLDYFGATAEETDQRGHCFMFWNVRKTVGAPVLIALVVGKAARDGHNLSSSDHVNHAVGVLRKLFGKASVPDPVASVVTDWGKDPFSYGAYSYVAIGASGEDCDLLARPVESCLFFAGEATCKEHPDTVGGAMISGLREAVRMMYILRTGNDLTEETAAMEAVHRYSDCERDEVRDFITRLDAVKISNSLYKHSLEGTRLLSREGLLKEMFFGAKTTAGRLVLAKELLKFPVGALKSFAGTKRGLATLNSWILDSLGKDGTQLLRQCVRILVRVATDLLAVRLSGIGKTIKEKVCVHTIRDIRAIASQLTSVWLETFHKEKSSGGLLRLLKQGSSVDSSRRKTFKDSKLGNSYQQLHDGAQENKGEVDCVISEEEKAAIAAAEKAHAAALAAAEAYKFSEAEFKSLQLPKIPSFHKFIRRERYAQSSEGGPRGRSPVNMLGRQDGNSDIRSCKVVDLSIKSSDASVDRSKNLLINFSQQSHSNEGILGRGEPGGRPVINNDILTKAWVDSSRSTGMKDFHAIERWQSQAAEAVSSGLSHPEMHMKDKEDSGTKIIPPSSGHHRQATEGSVSNVSVNKEPVKNHSRGSDLIKQSIVDFVGSLLMPLYKAKKIDRDGYKSIMKKTTIKVMEQATDAEKAMPVHEFLHYKRKSKIRDLVDIFIARHLGAESILKP